MTYEKAKIGDILIIDCHSCQEAELRYSALKNEGCWQIYQGIRIVWSWRKCTTVARFKMIKTEYRKPIDIHEVFRNLQSAYSVLYEAKRKRQSNLN